MPVKNLFRSGRKTRRRVAISPISFRGLIGVGLMVRFIRAGPRTHHDQAHWTRRFPYCLQALRELPPRCGAAFSLMTYDDARPWAKAMPPQAIGAAYAPWGASKVWSFPADPSLTPVGSRMIVELGGGRSARRDPLLPETGVD